MSYCNGCGKWAGAFAAPAGANIDHLCKCLTAGQRAMLAAIPPLIGAQPAPAAPSGYLHEVDETAHGRGCLRMYSSAAESPWAHWQDAYKAKCVLKTTPLFAAPAAQPADSAMEVLRELVDAHDAFHAWMQAPTITPGEEWDHTARMNTAWTRARALVAKETPHG